MIYNYLSTELLSLSEHDETEQEKTSKIILNLTSSKDINTTSTTSAGETDCCTSLSLSTQQDMATSTELLILVSLREYTYNTSIGRTTRSSVYHRLIITNCRSYLHSTNSLSPSIERQQTTTIDEKDISSKNINIYSIRSSTNPILSTLSTINNEESAIILQKSLASSASSLPNTAPIMTIHQNERLLSNLIPKQNINPLILQHH